MASKIGRNDSCSCGSGKKYKNCCGREGFRPGSRKLNQLLAGLFLSALLVVVALSFIQIGDPDIVDDVDQSPPPITINRNINPGQQPPVQVSAQPSSVNAAAPQKIDLSGNTSKDNPPRPGSVWSEEHGHWHKPPTQEEIPAYDSRRSRSPKISVDSQLVPGVSDTSKNKILPDAKVVPLKSATNDSE